MALIAPGAVIGSEMTCGTLISPDAAQVILVRFFAGAGAMPLTAFRAGVVRVRHLDPQPPTFTAFGPPMLKMYSVVALTPPSASPAPVALRLPLRSPRSVAASLAASVLER